MSHRKPQVESVLKRALSEVLTRRMSDPRIEGLVSITQVDVSPNLHEAQVFVSVLPEKYEKRTIAALSHGAGHIHTLLCKAVRMRAVPRLVFRLDGSIKKQNAVFDAITRAIGEEAQVSHSEDSS